MKHKVFFLPPAQGSIKHQRLAKKEKHVSGLIPSYACELCILQTPETAVHLFLRCNFAKACWDSIGVTAVTTRHMPQTFRAIKDTLVVPFFMEIIILMIWSLWRTRNDWIFNNIDPSVAECRRKLKAELSLLLLRARQDHIPALDAWTANL
jgi:hypothetical protein